MLGDGVDIGCRLVEYEEIRPAKRRPDEGDELLLPQADAVAVCIELSIEPLREAGEQPGEVFALEDVLVKSAAPAEPSFEVTSAPNRIGDASPFVQVTTTGGLGIEKGLPSSRVVNCKDLTRMARPRLVSR